eukprot:jgi/Botrbrau1/15711/Bobra.4_1s0082.1
MHSLLAPPRAMPDIMKTLPCPCPVSGSLVPSKYILIHKQGQLTVSTAFNTPISSQTCCGPYFQKAAIHVTNSFEPASDHAAHTNSFCMHKTIPGAQQQPPQGQRPLTRQHMQS